MTNTTTPLEGFGSSKKINSRSPTKYKPLELSDESVYDDARHFYTLEEIADRYNVSISTVRSLHGEAFQAGKDNSSTLPRILLAKIFKDFSDPEINFSRMDVPTGTLLKAIELHGKKYEGMGMKTEVHHTGKIAYDGVESAPEIIERPDDDPV